MDFVKPIVGLFQSACWKPMFYIGISNRHFMHKPIKRNVSPFQGYESRVLVVKKWHEILSGPRKYVYKIIRNSQ